MISAMMMIIIIIINIVLMIFWSWWWWWWWCRDLGGLSYCHSSISEFGLSEGWCPICSRRHTTSPSVTQAEWVEKIFFTSSTSCWNTNHAKTFGQQPAETPFNLLKHPKLSDPKTLKASNFFPPHSKGPKGRGLQGQPYDDRPWSFQLHGLGGWLCGWICRWW